jgi:hypothetical protein
VGLRARVCVRARAWVDVWVRGCVCHCARNAVCATTIFALFIYTNSIDSNCITRDYNCITRDYNCITLDYNCNTLDHRTCDVKQVLLNQVPEKE